MSKSIRSFISHPLIVAVLPLCVATGCVASELTSPPVACQVIIPGVDTQGAVDGDIVEDVAFYNWFDTLAQPVDYDMNGFWYDGFGDAVGWSSQEDGEICVISHAVTP